MNELNLFLKEEAIELIENYSKRYDISKENLCEMILNSWSTYGGSIWTGNYEKARVFLIDWPSNRKIIKLEEE